MLVSYQGQQAAIDIPVPMRVLDSDSDMMRVSWSARPGGGTKWKYPEMHFNKKVHFYVLLKWSGLLWKEL